MSIFVSQPHKRVRRLSGLGAYAALAPEIQRRGSGAFLDNDVCDYEALVQRIAAELGVLGQYQGKPALAMQDAAIYAHELYETYCANGTVDVNVTYGQGSWWWPGNWGRRRRHHRGGGGHHSAPHVGHPRDMVATPVRHSMAPSAMHARPMPMSRSASHATSMHARPVGVSRHGHKGLGDVNASTALTLQRQLQSGRSPRPVTTSPQSIAEMQARATATLAPQMTWTPGTWDGSDGPAPMPSSFTVEGALPGGVAFLLAGALGLLGASFVFGGK